MTDYKEIKKCVNECGLNIKEPLHSAVLAAVNKALDKQIAATLTHEATLYDDLTCPNCKNVVSKREMWWETVVTITSPFCQFCGQKLDWAEEMTTAPEIAPETQAPQD